MQTSRVLLEQCWWGDDHKQNNTKLRDIFKAAFGKHYLAFAALTCVSMEAGLDMDTVTSRWGNFNWQFLVLSCFHDNQCWRPEKEVRYLKHYSTFNKYLLLYTHNTDTLHLQLQKSCSKEHWKYILIPTTTISLGRFQGERMDGFWELFPSWHPGARGKGCSLLSKRRWR